MSARPRRHWLAWIVVLLALNMGGWLAFDGGCALLVGDYVTPRSGDYAGRLGPWADLVTAAGIEPRSTLMKSIHVGLGAAWLLVTAAFSLRRPWAWHGMIACAVATLWYLPVGTLVGLIEIVLLLLPPLRRPGWKS